MRDTARWPPLMRTTRHGKRRPRKLRDLVLEHLDRKIQEGEHGSVEDATAAMDLYKLFAADWEASLGCDFIVENYDNGDSTYVLVKPGAFDETSATNAKDGKWWPYSVVVLLP